jgi:hypothetical protein
VLVEAADEAAQRQLDAEVRAYYQGVSEVEDELWGDRLQAK